MKKNRELHVWLNFNSDDLPSNIEVTYDNTLKVLEKDLKSIIHTTQIHFFSTRYIHQYELYAHKDGKTIHVQLGNNNPSTERIIKEGHDLENLLLAGEFDFDNPYGRD